MPTYKTTIEVTVDQECKLNNDAVDLDDREYIRQELGWLESSFSGASWSEIEEVE